MTLKSISVCPPSAAHPSIHPIRPPAHRMPIHPYLSIYLSTDLVPKCLGTETPWCRNVLVPNRPGNFFRLVPKRLGPNRLGAETTWCRNVCKSIQDQQDAASLQTDLNHLQEWEREWQIFFNSDKCEHIQITSKRKIIQTSYNIHGQTLNETSKAKYLGVTIDNTLSWNSHIDTVTKKANQTTAFLRRNLSSCPKDVKAKCYMSIVRPQLEYALMVWDPVTKSSMAKVESVQRHAARFCYSDYRWTSSVISVLQELDWEDLQSRREQNKVAMMYRIVNNLVEIPADQYVTAAGVSTRGHQQRFLVQYCSINAYNGSFFPSAVCLWNRLPASAISSPTMDDFKILIIASIPRLELWTTCFSLILIVHKSLPARMF